jgi:hypothetical protein
MILAFLWPPFVQEVGRGSVKTAGIRSQLEVGTLEWKSKVLSIR